MAIAEDTSSIMVSTPRAWARLTDFSRWKEWLHVPDAQEKGLGDDFRVLCGEKTEMKLGLFSGEKQMQNFVVSDWDPPRHLTLTLDGWNFEHAAIYKGKPIQGLEGRMIASTKSMALSYTVELTPVSESETKMLFRAEVRFTNGIVGPLLNLLLPMKHTLTKVAMKFTDNFAKSF